MVAGLGDGSICIYDYSSNEVISRIQAHRALISSVILPHWTVNDDVIISSGNDCNILLWKLSDAVVSYRGVNKKKKYTKGRPYDSKEEVIANAAVEPNMVAALEIEHAMKPNCIAANALNGGSVFVVDASNDVHVYTGVQR